ncbi:MAG TPA: hypothetical protein VJY54_01105, partial [Lachnospiraceae bacterium]|nr:hypothetical protein [Lachnospiraceae bacterium]
KIPEQSIKGINWTDFIIKYKNEMKDEFFCGYWCHLMQNAIWFHDIVNPYIRIYPKEIKKDCYQKVYRDYERLNYLLPKQYGIDDLSIHNVHIANAEVKEQNFDTKICDFQSQFYAHKCEKGELEILQWDIICEYISKCVEFCVKEIIALRSGNERTESSDFYVSI